MIKLLLLTNFFLSSGEFSYEVWNSSVKARLNFPYKFYGVNLKFYRHNFFLSFFKDIKTYNKNAIDIDYEMKNNNILAYSENINKLKNFTKFEIGYGDFLIGKEEYKFVWFNEKYNSNVLKYNVKRYFVSTSIKKNFLI